VARAPFNRSEQGQDRTTANFFPAIHAIRLKHNGVQQDSHWSRTVIVRLALRYPTGGKSYSRLNARLNAASDA
jgi:hypothetical protein